MKFVNGLWYYRGQSYATLYEALAAVWPYALSTVGRQKETAPSVNGTGSGKAKT